MQTRKDYVKAAEIVGKFWSDYYNAPSGSEEQLRKEMKARSIELAFVAFFSGDNPRFNESKFCVACRKK